jgi:hypothetical protein
MLRELGRVTRRGARILATSRAPGTFHGQHRRYWNDKLARGAELGAVRLVLDFKGTNKRALAWYWIAPSALMELAWKNGWRVAEVFGDGRADEGYSVVMEKR